MEEQEPLLENEEEEEFIFLDPEHVSALSFNMYAICLYVLNEKILYYCSSSRMIVINVSSVCLVY